jgi:phosphatidylinositol alpha-1,6-mannosyltransferase
LPLTRYPERWLLKACYAHARHIVVPSAFTRDAILRQAKESYAIDIVHNGVDFERFQKIIDGTRLRTLHGSGPFLLTVGGLKPRKGQDLVIRALPSIIAAHPNVHYLLVGEGSMRSELQNLASSLGVSHHITFVGSKTGDDLVTYFHLADIYVHTPKVVHWNFEGFGIVYLEAGACGVPSVATDAGGVRDAIVDQKTGIIVPDGDCAAIAQAVTSLLSDPQKRATMGADAKKYAAEHDWRYIVERFLPFYRDCV